MLSEEVFAIIAMLYYHSRQVLMAVRWPVQVQGVALFQQLTQPTDMDLKIQQEMLSLL